MSDANMEPKSRMDSTALSLTFIPHLMLSAHNDPTELRMGLSLPPFKTYKRICIVNAQTLCRRRDSTSRDVY